MSQSQTHLRVVAIQAIMKVMHLNVQFRWIFAWCVSWCGVKHQLLLSLIHFDFLPLLCAAASRGPKCVIQNKCVHAITHNNEWFNSAPVLFLFIFLGSHCICCCLSLPFVRSVLTRVGIHFFTHSWAGRRLAQNKTIWWYYSINIEQSSRRMSCFVAGSIRRVEDNMNTIIIYLVSIRHKQTGAFARRTCDDDRRTRINA